MSIDHNQIKYSDPIVEKAKNLALSIHQHDLTEVSKSPFTDYLNEVVDNIYFCCPSYMPNIREVLVTAWLHAAITKNPESISTIRQVFGKRITNNILALTLANFSKEWQFREITKRLESGNFAVKIVYFATVLPKLGDLICSTLDDELIVRMREVWLPAVSGFKDSDGLTDDEVMSLDILCEATYKFMRDTYPGVVDDA